MSSIHIWGSQGGDDHREHNQSGADVALDDADGVRMEPLLIHSLNEWPAVRGQTARREGRAVLRMSSPPVHLLGLIGPKLRNRPSRRTDGERRRGDPKGTL